jgi:hypothetical protein
VRKQIDEMFAAFDKSLKQALQQYDVLKRALARDVQRRPVDRKALFDPAVQGVYNSIVDICIMTMVQRNALGRQALPPEWKKVVNDRFGLLGWQTLSVMEQFEPEAVPALVRGIHLASRAEPVG